MEKLNFKIIWVSLLFIISLIILAIAGAFLGAEKARLLFNSLPLAIYWYCLALLFIIGLIKFSNFYRNPALFLMHLSCLFVLIGSMWASEPGHRIYNRFFGKEKIAKGYMLIPEGKSENYVIAQDFVHQLGQLPFSIKLNDFYIEYDKINNSLKNFCSDITIIDNRKAIINKTIKVNKPLHYGGYHFYQYSYDSQTQQYTILLITSDNGLYVVYAGYWMLCFGIFWHFFKKLLKI